MAWKSSFRQNYRTTFSSTVPTYAAGISHVVADVEAPGGEKWEHLKSGGKQWQTTPKNLPRMQCTRAIPVAWLNSGLCPDRPKGWIPIIIISYNRVQSLKLKIYRWNILSISSTFKTEAICSIEMLIPRLQYVSTRQYISQNTGTHLPEYTQCSAVRN